MDNLRGNFGSADQYDGHDDYDLSEEDIGGDLPPASIGTDERRMQVRAYNHWASLLEDRNFPSIEDLEPEELTDFGPYSVLLDFTSGIEDPAIPYLGKELAGECGTDDEISLLSDVPSRSLLSRITDHYMQILANQAPIGFEAEFVNQRDVTILYRGILLPYSSDGETIDFIYGVINWKEMADQATTDELLLEIDQALEDNDAVHQYDDSREADPVTDWADGPGGISADNVDHEDIADFVPQADINADEPNDDGFPEPEFGGEDMDEEDTLEDDDNQVVARLSSLIKPQESTRSFEQDSDDGEEDDWDVTASKSPLLSTKRQALAPHGQAEGYESNFGSDTEFDASVVEEFEPGKLQQAGLHDCLAEARELAMEARTSEDRTRATLYAAVGRAYDVSLAAQESPEEFEELISENGLTFQDRAPMTPIVKLVFGADYDKTRLTEYASVLSHAQRLGIEQGGLSGFLNEAEGGLKGVVQTERRIRKEESGKAVDPVDAPKHSLAKKLRKLEGKDFASLDPQGPEFGVVMIRRLTTGEIVVLGEVNDDIPLVEKVARKLVR